LLGAICIGVSWIFAFFVPVEFNFANPHDIFGQFSLRWAMFFVLFGGITLYILRQRETSTAGLFAAVALFVLWDGFCWATLSR
jgi:FtsH-binding integral membrane protein